MSATASPEMKITATSKVGEGLWKRAKKVAIDLGCPVSDLVEQGLVLILEEKEAEAKRELEAEK